MFVTASDRPLVDDVIRDAGRIDLLVNNAGVTLVGALEETSLRRDPGALRCQLLWRVCARLTLLPHMRAARRGRIVFVSSVLGLLPAPFMGIYAATKHALGGYAESLDHELRAFGMRSILVEPSFTATRSSKSTRSAQRLSAYASARARLTTSSRRTPTQGARPEAAPSVSSQQFRQTTPKLRYPVGGCPIHFASCGASSRRRCSTPAFGAAFCSMPEAIDDESNDAR